tara:strand:+ start:378 stop:686 length:309 start_codon:yes stop_codon:yes gene_type:complete
MAKWKSSRVYDVREVFNQSDVVSGVSKKYDSVERPSHYNQEGIECIDYIKQVLGLDGFIAYCHGNMIKYQHRYRYKQNPVEDMKKAEWYIKRMNEALAEKHK